jgi:DNA polymerase-1
MSEKPVILVDGSSYLFRAYHALPPLTTSSGVPTGALHGVLSMIRKLIKTTHPEEMAIVFDTKTKNHRHALFPAYKANRPEMPEELKGQIAPLYDIIRAMGIPLVVIEGVEADDVIGSLAKMALQQNRRVVISTGDKDFAQLVSSQITLVNTMTDTLLDPDGVIQKFGVPPEHIVDYLALIGDTVDNITGIEKVGPKTAVKWLQTYHSLDNIVQNAHHIGGKIGENLRRAIPQLPLYKELVTIQTNQPLPVTLADLRCQSPNFPLLEQYYTRFEFKSWLKELDSLNAVHQETPPLEKTEAEKRYTALTTPVALENFLKKRPSHAPLSVDLETTSLDIWLAEIVGIALCYEPDKAVYLPVLHSHLSLAPLIPILEDETIPKVGHNLKYDMSVLRNEDILLKGIVCDTMLASYVVNSTTTRHSLEAVALHYLHQKTISYEEVVGKGAKQKNFSEVPLADATQYACEDADVTLQLARFFKQKLAETPKKLALLQDIEIPLIPVLSAMERYGVLIDAALLKKQSRVLEKSCADLEQQVFLLSGEAFNLNSPKQLQEMLYEKLGVPILQKTPTGQPSTSESVLQALSADYELPQLILQYRSLSKLKSTYTDRLPEQIHPKTGRIHTSYHQAVTSTGRLSSSDPNLQNIPVRTPEGRQIRAAFIAPPGFVILAADYSQIELRIMAHLSQDAGLMRAFQQGLDIHKATAGEIFHVPLEEVTPEQRRHAKTINFGLIYGMSAFGLAKQLEVSRQTAQEYIDHYFHRYPGVKTFMDKVRQEAFDQGFVETLLGRQLYLPDIRARNMALRKAAERTAINAPMQGTAADLIKKAMIALHAYSTQHSDDIRMIMQVHDELVFEVKEAFVPKATQAIHKHMVEALSLSVPLEVSMGVGLNWDAAH